jgi:hypothetical protein
MYDMLSSQHDILFTNNFTIVILYSNSFIALPVSGAQEVRIINKFYN